MRKYGMPAGWERECPFGASTAGKEPAHALLARSPRRQQPHLRAFGVARHRQYTGGEQGQKVAPTHQSPSLSLKPIMTLSALATSSESVTCKRAMAAVACLIAILFFDGTAGKARNVA